MLSRGDEKLSTGAFRGLPIFGTRGRGAVRRTDLKKRKRTKANLASLTPFTAYGRRSVTSDWVEDTHPPHPPPNSYSKLARNALCSRCQLLPRMIPKASVWRMDVENAGVTRDKGMRDHLKGIGTSDVKSPRESPRNTL